MKLVQEFPPHRNHWRSLHNYLQHKPNHQTVRIGYAPRFNLYGVKKGVNREVVDPRMRLMKKFPCKCIPPCECSWMEQNYNEPWTLSILKELEAKSLTEQLEEGDIVVVGADSSAQLKEEVDPKDESNNIEPHGNEKLEKHCSCIVPHECHWDTPKYAKPPYVLSVIRLYKSYVNSGREVLFDCKCKATRQ